MLALHILIAEALALLRYADCFCCIVRCKLVTKGVQPAVVGNGAAANRSAGKKEKTTQEIPIGKSSNAFLLLIANVDTTVPANFVEEAIHPAPLDYAALKSRLKSPDTELWLLKLPEGVCVLPSSGLSP
jgi:hypothetical protein